jgi:hypothetical protein
VTSWQAVLTAALIGSERAALPVPRPGSGDDPAAALLDDAALLTVARRGGLNAGHATPPAEPGPDPRPEVSAAAGRTLARILHGDPVAAGSGAGPSLLAEWLIASTARGLRPPPRYLPVLLDRGRRIATVEEAGLRGLVAVAGGPRARWLAALNPAWSYLPGEPVPAALPRLEYLDRTAFAEQVTMAMRQLSNVPLTANRELRSAGRSADPALGAPGALADFPPESPNVLHAMLALVRFRYVMLKELEL